MVLAKTAVLLAKAAVLLAKVAVLLVDFGTLFGPSLSSRSDSPHVWQDLAYLFL